jgi:hypothetical protein
MMDYLSTNKLEPISVNRELYINADFNHPDANVTEIQMGVASTTPINTPK